MTAQHLRSEMKVHKTTLLVAMVAALTMLAGCANRSWNDSWNAGDTGAVIGGVTGAAVGHQFGGGSGQTIATVVGAIAGSILGRRLGRNMSQNDRQLFGNTLASGAPGNTNYWTNDRTNDSYWVTPTSSTYTANNRVCRQFRMQANIEGRNDYVNGTACRQPDGSWVVQ